MTTLLVLLGVIVIIVIFLVQVFNRFAKNRNMVKDGWSNIDVALKRRYDLIPNLVASIKGYSSHERDVLEAVTLARSQANRASSDLQQTPGDEQKLQTFVCL